MINMHSAGRKSSRGLVFDTVRFEGKLWKAFINEFEDASWTVGLRKKCGRAITVCHLPIRYEQSEQNVQKGRRHSPEISSNSWV